MTKNELFKIFNDEILEKYSINEVCKKLGLHVGTIKRWIVKCEVPLEYFLQINKLLDEKYEIEITKEEKFKSLDQFFTKKEVAKKLVDETIEFIEENWEIDFKNYFLIEPSAGDGSFYVNFPESKFKKFVGLDVEPRNEKIVKMDWFDYKVENEKNIVIGNPPFGLRGQMALKFINYAAEFCDFICFILPPLFNSNGKGSPMLRVNKNFYLAKQKEIKEEFLYPNGKKVVINGVFQIWSRLESEKVEKIEIVKKESEFVKVYSLSNGNTSSSKRNVKMIGKCDFYFPSTTFNEIKVENCFEKLPHNRGYGLVILKEKEKITNMIKSINWNDVGFKSTNSANNLRSQLIIDAIENELKKCK